MLFEIQVLSVTGAVLNSGNNPHVPFSRRVGTINLENPTIRTLVLEDDDNRLDNGLFAPEEKQQLIHADLNLGSTTLEKGTRIGFHNGALIEDADGNRFVFMYPRVFAPYNPEGGDLLTDRNSMLVIPLPDPVTGSFPSFDPTKNNFSFKGTYVVNDAQMFLELEPPSSQGPDTGNPPPDPSSDPDPQPDPQPDPPEDPVDPVVGSPCFAAGTMILTASGPRPVEALRPGELVHTRDAGLQPLLWSGHRALDRADLDLAPNQRPILISQGAIGPSQPARDLVVSPQHRILLRSPIVSRMFAQDEVLVPARLLVGLHGIRVLREAEAVTYWHLLFADHQVITSEGAWTESLLPGPMALRAFGPAARAEIHALVTPEAVAPARLLPPGKSVRALAERHRRNPRRQLVENDPRPPLPEDMLTATAG